MRNRCRLPAAQAVQFVAPSPRHDPHDVSHASHAVPFQNAAPGQRGRQMPSEKPWLGGHDRHCVLYGPDVHVAQVGWHVPHSWRWRSVYVPTGQALTHWPWCRSVLLLHRVHALAASQLSQPAGHA